MCAYAPVGGLNVSYALVVDFGLCRSISTRSEHYSFNSDFDEMVVPRESMDGSIDPVRSNRMHGF